MISQSGSLFAKTKMIELPCARRARSRTPLRKVTEVSENLGLPEDLNTLSAEDLAKFETEALQRFDALLESNPTDPAQAQAEVAEMRQLSVDIKKAKAEVKGRAELAAERESFAAERKTFAAEETPVAEQELVTAAAGNVQVNEPVRRKLN